MRRHETSWFGRCGLDCSAGNNFRQFLVSRHIYWPVPPAGEYPRLTARRRICGRPLAAYVSKVKPLTTGFWPTSLLWAGNTSI